MQKCESSVLFPQVIVDGETAKVDIMRIIIYNFNFVDGLPIRIMRHCNTKIDCVFFRWFPFQPTIYVLVISDKIATCNIMFLH